MKLTGQQIQQIRDALLDGYPQRDLLRMMVRIELNANLDEIVDGANQRVLIFNLVSWAEQNGSVDKLITGAHNQNSGNSALQQLVSEWHTQVSSGMERMPVPPRANVSRESEPKSIDLFLSYSRHDIGAMRQVFDVLRGVGWSVWTDEGLKPGTEDWQYAISEAVSQAKAMVVLLSPNAKESRWVNNEIRYAQTHSKRVFPLLIAGDDRTSVPISLINTEWVDGRKDLYQNLVQTLLPAISSQLAPPVKRQTSRSTADTQRPADAKPKTLAGVGTGGKISSTTQTRYIAVVIVVAIIVGAYALYQIERSLFPLKPPDPTRSVDLSPPTQAESTFTPSLVAVPQTLNFVNGIAVVQGTAGFNQAQRYLFYGSLGQNIRVQLSSQPAGANFEVVSQDNGTVYKPFADPSLDWSYVLPVSQNYRVTVNSVDPVVYTLTVTLGGG